MKNKLETDEDQTTNQIRRSTRTASVNKLSASKKRLKLPASVVTSVDDGETGNVNIDSLSKLQSTEPIEDLSTPIKNISPIKRLPTIQESPSTQSTNFNGNTSIVTPRSNKTYSFTENTPFKEDLLACSQHFDPQADVAWDCRSPDAINFLRKGRRRRHHSDVSDIVTQLQICKEELHENPSESNTSPLLGLWMNDVNYFTHQKPEQKLCRGRKRRSRNKSKPNNENDSSSKALFEKLQLVMEKCEDNKTSSNKNSVDKRDRRRSASVGNESKDLFELTLSCVGNKDDDVDSWSDNDLFEDDFFIIKATQIEDVQKCNKRKWDKETNDEPPVKTVKYFENQKSTVKPTLPSLSATRFTRLNSKPSPFKKHKSFNDRDEYTNSQERDPHISMQYNSKQIKNSVTSSKQTNTTISSSQTFSGSRRCIASVAKPNSFTVSKQCTVMSSKPAPSNTLTQSVNRSTTTFKPGMNISSKPGISVKCKQTTKPCMSMDSQHSAPTSCSKTVSYTTESSNIGVTNRLNTVTLSTESTLNQPVSALCKPVETFVSTGGKNSVISSKIGSMDRNNVGDDKEKVITTSTGFQSRRSSAAFDTSLSDDILCQLVEPDEILDSQIPVCANTEKSCHIDEALKFFHEEPKLKDSIPGNNGCDSLKRIHTATTRSVADRSTANYFNHHSNNNYKGASTIDDDVALITDKQKALCLQANAVNKSQKVKKEAGIETKTKINNPVNETKKIYMFKSKSPGQQHAISSRLKCEPQSTDFAMKNASEDLFMSDDDELAEPQLWALLDTVESTQTNSVKVLDQTTNNAVKSSKEDLQEERLDITKNTHEKMNKFSRTGQLDISNQSQSDTNTLQTPIKSQPDKITFTCSPEDIEKKRQEALNRRKLKMEKVNSSNGNLHDSKHTTSFLDKINSCDHNNVAPNKNSHETKSSPTERNTLGTVINPARQSNSSSPLKCSQEEIENKKQEAIKRLQQKTKQKVPSLDSSQSNDGSIFKCSPETPIDSQNPSPFKLSPEDDESVRLESVSHIQLWSDSGVNNNNLSGWDTNSFKCTPETPQKSLTENSPFKCSPEDIEKKRLEAIKRKEQKSQVAGRNDQSQKSEIKKDDVENCKSLQLNKQICDSAKDARDVILPPRNTYTKNNVDKNQLRNYCGTILSSSTGVNSDKKVSPITESPCKYSQAEIELKKQAALQRRLEKMKVAKNLKNSL